MTLPAIQDILAAWPGRAWLELSRGDQSSGTGAGQTIVKELRDPYFVLHAVSRVLSPNEIRYWKGRLETLDNGRGRFYGYDPLAKYPIAYPNGSWPTGGAFNGLTAAVEAIGDDYLTLKLKQLPVGYTGKVGDGLSITFGDDDSLQLLTVGEDFTAGGDAKTGWFAVRPPVSLGVEVGDAVAVKRPACVMMIAPGSLSYPKDISAWGAISFDGIEVPE